MGLCNFCDRKAVAYQDGHSFCIDHLILELDKDYEEFEFYDDWKYEEYYTMDDYC